jgi:hypothetical protein
MSEMHRFALSLSLSRTNKRDERDERERREKRKEITQKRERSLGLFGRVISLFSRFFFLCVLCFSLFVFGGESAAKLLEERERDKRERVFFFPFSSSCSSSCSSRLLQSALLLLLVVVVVEKEEDEEDEEGRGLFSRDIEVDRLFLFSSFSSDFRILIFLISSPENNKQTQVARR